MTLAACIWYESSTKSGNKNKIGPSHKITHRPLLSRPISEQQAAFQQRRAGRDVTLSLSVN